MAPIKADQNHWTDGSDASPHQEHVQSSPDNKDAGKLVVSDVLAETDGDDGSPNPDPDPDKGKQRYQVALGNLLGNSAFTEIDQLLDQYGMTDQLLASGHALVDDLMKSLNKQAQTSFGLPDEEQAISQLMGPLSEMLKQKADEWLASKDGQKLATGLSNTGSKLFRDHPWTAIGAVLLASAAAYATDMPIQPLMVTGKFGKRVTAGSALDLGKGLKDIALGSLSAQMQYTATHLHVGVDAKVRGDGAYSGVINLSAENKNKVDGIVTKLALDEKGNVSGTASLSHHAANFNADLGAVLGPEGDVTAKLLLILKDPDKVNQLLFNVDNTKEGVSGTVNLTHDKGAMKTILDGALGTQGDLSAKLEVALYAKKLKAITSTPNGKTGNPEVDKLLTYDDAGNLTEESKLLLKDVLLRHDLTVALTHMGDRIALVQSSYTEKGKLGSVTATGTVQDDGQGNTSNTVGLTLSDKKKQNTLATKYGTNTQGTFEQASYQHQKGTTLLTATGSQTKVDDVVTNALEAKIADTDAGFSIGVGTSTSAGGNKKHANYEQTIQRKKSTTQLSSNVVVDEQGKVSSGVGVEAKGDLGDFTTTATLDGDQLKVALASNVDFGEDRQIKSTLDYDDDGGQLHVNLTDVGGQPIPCRGYLYDASSGTLSMMLTKSTQLSLANTQVAPVPRMRAEEQLTHFKASLVQQLGTIGVVGGHYDPVTKQAGGSFDLKKHGFHVGAGGEVVLGTQTKSWFASVGYDDADRYTQFLIDLKRTYAPTLTMTEFHGVVAIAIDETRLRFEAIGTLGSEAVEPKGTARGVISQPIGGGIRLLSGAQVDYGSEHPRWSVLGGAEYAGIPVFVSYGGKDESTGKNTWSVGLLLPLSKK